MKDSSLPQVHIDKYPKLVKEGVFILDDQVWSTQKRIARIYGRSIPTINDHLKKIYREKELMKALTERERPSGFCGFHMNRLRQDKRWRSRF